MLYILISMRHKLTDMRQNTTPVNKLYNYRKYQIKLLYNSFSQLYNYQIKYFNLVCLEKSQ
jgi:hypothetical protein